MTRSERVYTVGLIVLAFLYILAIGEFLVFLRHPPGGDPQATRLAFELVVFVSSTYLAVTALILLIRARWPVQGRLVVTALNVILLLSFPFGTALGVYYFWKVNRNTAYEGAAPLPPPSAM